MDICSYVGAKPVGIWCLKGPGDQQYASKILQDEVNLGKKSFHIREPAKGHIYMSPEVES